MGYNILHWASVSYNTKQELIIFHFECFVVADKKIPYLHIYLLYRQKYQNFK